MIYIDFIIGVMISIDVLFINYLNRLILNMFLIILVVVVIIVLIIIFV